MTASTLETTPARATASGSPILELRKLEKPFTGTHALKPADLAFEAGEIHAIVGENGAGKSTLIKLLTGVTPRTSGEIIWKGRSTNLSTPNEAIASSVIGGTSLFGAVGTVWGPILGAVILATIRNGANLMNVNSFWQFIITGGLIILIVYFDGLRRMKR